MFCTGLVFQLIFWLRQAVPKIIFGYHPHLSPPTINFEKITHSDILLAKLTELWYCIYPNLFSKFFFKFYWNSFLRFNFYINQSCWTILTYYLPLIFSSFPCTQKLFCTLLLRHRSITSSCAVLEPGYKPVLFLSQFSIFIFICTKCPPSSQVA